MGDWTVDHICFFTEPVGKYFFDKCPEGKVEAFVDMSSGEFSFDKKGNYSEAYDYFGRVVLTMPRSCLAAGKTCDDLAGADATCDIAGANCRCTTPLKFDPSGPPGRGMYHRTGTTLDLEGDTALNYCAKGDTLKLETRVGMPEMGDSVQSTMQIVLKR